VLETYHSDDCGARPRFPSQRLLRTRPARTSAAEAIVCLDYPPPFVVGQMSVVDVLQVHPRLGRDQSVEELLLRHFQRENAQEPPARSTAGAISSARAVFPFDVRAPMLTKSPGWTPRSTGSLRPATLHIASKGRSGSSLEHAVADGRGGEGQGPVGVSDAGRERSVLAGVVLAMPEGVGHAAVVVEMRHRDGISLPASGRDPDAAITP